MRKQLWVGLVPVVAIWAAAPLHAADGLVRISVNQGYSGAFAAAAESTKEGIELARKELEAQGGLTIGGKRYSVELIYNDTGSDKSKASAQMLKAVTQDKAIAVIPSLNTDRAIQTVEIANSFATPAITSWTVSPKVTENRPYAFRTGIDFHMQALATAKLAEKEWKAAKMAVLYDEVNGYASSMAKEMKEVFEKQHGPGSVVAFETIRPGETDYTRQLKAIAASGADFLYTPQNYVEVPMIIKQAKALGWMKPITGSTFMGGAGLMDQCGDDCKGKFFTSNFVSVNTSGSMKTFRENFQKTYNKMPYETAALGYDAVRIIFQALSRIDNLSGDIMQDRKKLREQIAATKNYDGATGKISYRGSGEPLKCAIIAKIDDNGQYALNDQACP